MSNEPQTAEDEVARARRVTALAHEVAEAINAGEAEGREILREVALSVLRDEVEVVEPTTAAAAVPPAGSFNPFGIGIPLVLIGAVMVFLFPPVGLFMFATAAIVLGWGVVTTLFTRK